MPVPVALTAHLHFSPVRQLLLVLGVPSAAEGEQEVMKGSVTRPGGFCSKLV